MKWLLIFAIALVVTVVLYVGTAIVAPPLTVPGDKGNTPDIAECKNTPYTAECKNTPDTTECELHILREQVRRERVLQKEASHKYRVLKRRVKLQNEKRAIEEWKKGPNRYAALSHTEECI